MFALLLMAIAWPAARAQVALKDGHPQTHVVQKGDTLWDVAARFLRDPWEWPNVWMANPSIKDPHRIYPGDRINLVFINGQPRLQLAERGRPTYKLSPRVRVRPTRQAVPLISIDAISRLVSLPRIVSPDEIGKRPYIMSVENGRVVAGVHDRIYVRGLENTEDRHFGIYRPGKELIDPESGESLGIEARHVGVAVLEHGGEVATLRLSRTYGEVLASDLVFPADANLEDWSGPLEPPPMPVDGRVISLSGALQEVGNYEVVALNKGAVDGLRRGHVLAVYSAGEVAADVVKWTRSKPAEWDDSGLPPHVERIDIDRRHPLQRHKLPDERAGLLLVFQVFERASHALVMELQRPVRMMDIVRRP